MWLSRRESLSSVSAVSSDRHKHSHKQVSLLYSQDACHPAPRPALFSFSSPDNRSACRAAKLFSVSALKPRFFLKSLTFTAHTFSSWYLLCDGRHMQDLEFWYFNLEQFCCLRLHFQPLSSAYRAQVQCSCCSHIFCRFALYFMFLWHKKMKIV